MVQEKKSITSSINVDNSATVMLHCVGVSRMHKARHPTGQKRWWHFLFIVANDCLAVGVLI